MSNLIFCHLSVSALQEPKFGPLRSKPYLLHSDAFKGTVQPELKLHPFSTLMRALLKKIHITIQEFHRGREFQPVPIQGETHGGRVLNRLKPDGKKSIPLSSSLCMLRNPQLLMCGRKCGRMGDHTHTHTHVFWDCPLILGYWKNVKEGIELKLKTPYHYPLLYSCWELYLKEPCRKDQR